MVDTQTCSRWLRFASERVKTLTITGDHSANPKKYRTQVAPWTVFMMSCIEIDTIRRNSRKDSYWKNRPIGLWFASLRNIYGWVCGAIGRGEVVLMDYSPRSTPGNIFQLTVFLAKSASNIPKYPYLPWMIVWPAVSCEYTRYNSMVGSLGYFCERLGSFVFIRPLDCSTPGRHTRHSSFTSTSAFLSVLFRKTLLTSIEGFWFIKLFFRSFCCLLISCFIAHILIWSGTKNNGRSPFL